MRFLPFCSYVIILKQLLTYNLMLNNLSPKIIFPTVADLELMACASRQIIQITATTDISSHTQNQNLSFYSFNYFIGNIYRDFNFYVRGRAYVNNNWKAGLTSSCTMSCFHVTSRQPCWWATT